MNRRLTGEHFIGHRRSAKTAGSFHGINPATGETMEPAYGDATEEEIQDAITLADGAFMEYRNVTGKRKAAFLEAIAERVIALGDQLVERCCAETGLPAGRINGERGRTVGQLRMFARLVSEGSWVDARIDSADPDRTPVPKPDVRSMARPLGLVGVFGASNFPLAFSVAGGDTVSALAAGCPVVFKGHPAHPGTCELVASAIIEAAQATGMPDGVFSLLHGRSHAVGMHIATHPLIRAIGFTGSLRGGKAIYDAAVRRDAPIPVYAEMGSINPVFILPEAARTRMDEIARGYAGSMTLGAGQFCTNPGVAIVLDENEAVNDLTAAMKDILAPMSPATMLTAGIHEAYESGADILAKQEGVSELVPSTLDASLNIGRARLFVTSSPIFLSNTHLHGEVFGPSSIVVSAKHPEEMIEIAQTLRGHLTASVFGSEQELRAYRPLLEVLERKAGRVIINGFPTGVEVCDAMVHGGPFPATTDSRTTSVGTLAINRFVRPVCFQNFPDEMLPEELRDANPLGIWRLADGQWAREC